MVSRVGERVLRTAGEHRFICLEDLTLSGKLSSGHALKRRSSVVWLGQAGVGSSYPVKGLVGFHKCVPGVELADVRHLWTDVHCHETVVDDGPLHFGWVIMVSGTGKATDLECCRGTEGPGANDLGSDSSNRALPLVMSSAGLLEFAYPQACKGISSWISTTLVPTKTLCLHDSDCSHSDESVVPWSVQCRVTGMVCIAVVLGPLWIWP